MALSLTQGWTSPIQYRLVNIDRKTGGKSNRNLTSASIDIIIKDKNGVQVLTRAVTKVDSVAGIIEFVPQAGDLLSTNSPLQIKFKVTEGGEVSFHPMGKHEIWEIFN